MDNKLLEYSTEDLLIAAIRKSILLKLTSIGSNINQSLIDDISLKIANSIDNVFIEFSKIVEVGFQKYLSHSDSDSGNE